MPHLGSISTEDLAFNALFAIFGACLSVGLALWLDVSGTTERLKARRAHAERSMQTRTSAKRGARHHAASVWLIWAELWSLIVGIALMYLTIWIQPMISDLALPAPMEAAAILTLMTGALFLISWTWASHLGSRLAARVALALALPLMLLGAFMLSKAIDSGLLWTIGKVLIWAILGLPLASLLVRTEPGSRLLGSRRSNR